MNFHSYGESQSKSVRIITGQSVLIDPSSRPKGTCLEVESGIARVYCPCEETEGMTLAFLQSGDQLRTDPHLEHTILPPKDLSETNEELPQLKQTLFTLI